MTCHLASHAHLAEVESDAPGRVTGALWVYMYNVRLSQNRTSNVLDYLFYKEDSEYQNASETDRELMRYWFTTTGFSYGRTMDQSGELTLGSGQNENRQRSRRVEFRIVMKSEEVIRQVLEMIDE